MSDAKKVHQIEKIAIFLNIDGVLRPISEDGKVRPGLENLKQFEIAIRPHLRVIEIVILSSARDLAEVEDFRSKMSARTVKVVVGMIGNQRTNRLEAIEGWLRQHGQREWLVVDDDAVPFKECRGRLFEVDGKVGFTPEDARSLRNQIRGTLFANSPQYMTPERLSEAAVRAVSVERRNKRMLTNDQVLQDQLARIKQIDQERSAMAMQVFSRIEALAPELAELAIGSFDSDEIAAAWFLEPISSKNPRSPLECLLCGDYEIVEIMLRQLAWDVI